MSVYECTHVCSTHAELLQPQSTAIAAAAAAAAAIGERDECLVCQQPAPAQVEHPKAAAALSGGQGTDSSVADALAAEQPHLLQGARI